MTGPVTTLKMEEMYPEWHDKAACAGEGFEKYFGTDSDIRPTMSTKQVRQAQEVCFSCPVMEECLEWAIRNGEEYGVWGGTSGRTRRRIQRWIKLDIVSTEEVLADYMDGKHFLYERDFLQEAI